MSTDALSLTALARAGFAELDRAGGRLAEFASATGVPVEVAAARFSVAADPDAALDRALRLARRAPAAVAALFSTEKDASPLVRVLGASLGLADFLIRRPEQLSVFGELFETPPSVGELVAEFLAAVDARPGETGAPVASLGGDDGWTALRVAYRRRLVQLAAFDLGQADQVAGVDAVAACLADLASAALEASLAVARAIVGDNAARAKLAVIAMGKTGARELNYVSDVDVVFVGEGDLDVATRLAQLTMRGADSPTVEPGLWQVDANLRPEGKKGALVRTFESHLAYYERWASPWEFQALLKARPIAGDLELAWRYVERLSPLVWSVSTRPGFVESSQRMRERVTENIPAGDVDWQLKLGPGGLRDIEFTVQLLQLVHGHVDPTVRERGTIQALTALAAGGYIGRIESAEFARDYRTLRVLEHRVQLSRLTRTHLMPRDEASQRALARASGLASSAPELVELWNALKLRVRSLHERLFYRPLLSAVARLRDEDFSLTSEQAEARLAAIGFRDPHGALAHLAALTTGVSRRATIQRTLLPVMLRWFADGADPDYGLLTFRRLSEQLGDVHWFLGLLRDSSGAAARLTRLLSGSRYVGELITAFPEAVAWLDDDDELRPHSPEFLGDEVQAVLSRHDDVEGVGQVLRALRRREVLRIAIGAIVGVLSIEEIATGLSDLAEAVLAGALAAIRRGIAEPIEFAVIAMGRFGGRELGFGSDVDVIYVFRAADATAALPIAQRIVAELARVTEDPRLPFELDLGLRPEGKNGVTARSLESYAAYYARWSLTWEAQALLRARGVAGDAALVADFEQLADAFRYPRRFGDAEAREVRRIKARVESERLPQGADPARHLKLGRGSLSDVEWFVQLEQLRHAYDEPTLRTTSTLVALQACVDGGHVTVADATRLRAAWVFASRARSALTLWANKTSDLLPADRSDLNGMARLLEYPPGSASRLEEDYLATTRRARQVFERGFYG